MGDDKAAAEERLRQEAAGLGVEDILALCYAFSHSFERLCLYLDVLRRHGGQRAQFASCLLCFDLGRQGSLSFQREFAYLADTIKRLAENEQLVHALVGDDPYLSFVWELCQEHLSELDSRFDAELSLAPVDLRHDVGTVDLLSDDDFADFGIPEDEAHLWLRFDEEVEAFLGGHIGRAAYSLDAGFRLRTKRDAERVETFLRELESLRDYVPMARGFLALVLLFYGTHMRSKSFFGAKNERKQALLRAGLAEFLQSAEEMWNVVGVLNPIHSEPSVWQKIGDVLEDYVRWLAENPAKHATAGLEHFDAVGRMVERYAVSGR